MQSSGCEIEDQEIATPCRSLLFPATFFHCCTGRTNRVRLHCMSCCTQRIRPGLLRPVRMTKPEIAQKPPRLFKTQVTRTQDTEKRRKTLRNEGEQDPWSKTVNTAFCRLRVRVLGSAVVAPIQQKIAPWSSR